MSPPLIPWPCFVESILYFKATHSNISLIDGVTGINKKEVKDLKFVSLVYCLYLKLFDLKIMITGFLLTSSSA